jgi:TrmH family RNA methyltransferase
MVAPQLEGAERGAALLQAINSSGREVARVTEAEFRSAAETESPQGVLAIAEIPRYGLETFGQRDSLRMLVLDAVQDPGNVGTILRTAAALGVDATVALPGTVDPWNAKVVRAAMGSSFSHPVIQVSMAELVDFARAQSVEIWGADASGDPIGEATPPDRLAVAVGNEGAGLSSSLRAAAKRLVSLPIAGHVESLNVAVATGILLYQLRK